MKHWAIAAACLLLATPPAAAQMAETPVTESTLIVIEEAEKQAAQVLVLGDALGGGLAAGMARVAEAAGDYEVSVRFNEESGLARPEVYDWPATVPKILGSNAYDVIVVMLGANDTQAIRSEGVRIPFDSGEWPAAYGAQVDRLLSELAASGARIIWVGPPPMRDPEYDAAIRNIAAIQRERVEARGFTFIDMRPELSAADGSYAETGPDDTGTVKRLRGRDGISFYKAGNNRMGQIVLAAIDSGGRPKPAPEAGQEPADAEKQSRVPVFGQVLMNGETYVVQPEGVTANAVMLAGAGLDSATALKALRDLSPAGSSAADLFRYGRAPAAPAGRADDFSTAIGN